MILIMPAALAALIYMRWNKEKKLTEGIVQGIILYHVALLIITNIFSIPACINRYTILGGWAVVLGMAVGIMAYQANGVYVKPQKGWFVALWRDSNLLTKIMGIVMLVLCAVLLIGALFTVPYNYDSMTYHLGRIAHWIDNGSVAHFVSCIDRQIYSPVLSEYEMLHMYLLNGNDSFLNLLQYSSMLFTAYIIYQVTKKLGTNRTFSMLSTFLYVTMPLTISQAITTQNDLLASMWFAIFLYYFVDFIQMEKITVDKEQMKKLVCIGAAVAFAFLTKSSICASMLFFMPWLLVVCIIRKDSLIKLVQSAGIAGATLLVLIAETLIRTVRSCGHLMADTTSANIMVATKNIKYILVNILKNYSMLITQHLYRPLNGFVYRIAIGLGAKFRVDFNNEAIAYHGFDFLQHMNMGDDMYSHDKTPSAVVAYLSLVAGIVLVIALISLVRKHVMQKKAEQKTAIENAFLCDRISIGFAVSSWLSLGFIMALLRWQPWGTRLMYPALAMMTITIGNVLGGIVSENKTVIRKWVAWICVASATILCVSPTIYNMKPAVEFMSHRMLDRKQQYFRANYRYEAYRDLTEYIAKTGAMEIGVSISGDGYDYPLWVLFRDKLPAVRLHHVILDENDPNKIDNQTDYPTYLLFVEQGRLEVGETKQYHGKTYECVFVSETNPDAPDSVLKCVE